MFLIYYSACLKPDVSLKAMIEEVKDIAEIYQWDYQVFNDDFPYESYWEDPTDDTRYGMSVTPPDSETLWLCFLSNGNIVGPPMPDLSGKKNQDEDLVQYLVRLWEGSRKEGLEIHKKVIDLFRYLMNKYLCCVFVKDISLYWQTGDEKIMDEALRKYDVYHEAMSYLKDFPIQPGETEDDYMKRTIQYALGSSKK